MGLRVLVVQLHTGASHRLKSLLSRKKLHSTLTFTSAFSHLLSPTERMRAGVYANHLPFLTSKPWRLDLPQMIPTCWHQHL